MIIAGTGHRPIKLGGYSDAAYQRLVSVARIYLHKLNATDVISGMALGWDQALAQAAMDLEIRLRAYIPFKGQESVWPLESQAKFNRMLEYAEVLRICSSGGYASWKMQKRNEDMVNDCQQVLAIWDGSSGGTANCVRYAQKVGKPITNCYETWRKLL